MEFTEEEQIAREIEAIFAVRPRVVAEQAMEFRQGEPQVCRFFLFATYRGYALYDGGGIGMRIPWDGYDEPPPPYLDLEITALEDGTEVDVLGDSLPSDLNGHAGSNGIVYERFAGDDEAEDTDDS